MALVNCPECDKEISDKALMCPHCGLAFGGRLFGYEYRSQKELFGLPLVHVVLGYGINSMTGKPRVAKGIIAIGHIALGGIAIGGLSLGVISFGGLALGIAAVGGAAVGLLLALGGMAIGFIAIGGGAFGYYALGGNAQNPEVIEFFKRWVGPFLEKSSQGQ